jgi:hypothetical protein
MVLSGMDALHACRDLGIEPKFVVYEGNDPLVFVLCGNFLRSHWPSAFLALFVEEHTTWPARGGDRKSQRVRGEIKQPTMPFDLLQPFAGPGTDLSLLVPFNFDNVVKSQRARYRCQQDSNGNFIPNTMALLPEVIEAVRAKENRELWALCVGLLPRLMIINDSI